VSQVPFSSVTVVLPDGKTKEFRSGEGKLRIIRTAPSGTPHNAPATVHYIEFVARIEEEEL